MPCFLPDEQLKFGWNKFVNKMKKRKTFKWFVLLLFFLYPAQKTFPQKIEPQKKVASVIIMPFDYQLRYPFSTDELREALIIGFQRRGFKIILDETSWSKVFDFNYELTNLSNKMADSIAAATNADLIVFGKVNNSVKNRLPGLYTTQETPNPILFKVFDTNKKILVLFERLNFIERWGLFENNLSFYDLGFSIATKISNLGY